MSTFNGLFSEIPFISVDRFEDDNLKSSLFFLSHCHADHMVGLSKTLKLPGKLYCSEISAIFLKKQFPNLESVIEILELEVPTTIFDKNNNYEELVVTSIPALHCPGSVMLIFETGYKKILYTGDFRHSKETLLKYPILTNSKYDQIFIDSTFLCEKYSNFPSLNKSIEIICELTRSWIKNGPKYKVIIEKCAQYGIELVLQELHRKLKIGIYVEEKQIEKYMYFPGMDSCLSNDFKSSSVIITSKNNLCYKNYIKLLDKNVNFRILKPTAIFWSKWNNNKPIHCHQGGEIYRIAFSTHSSLKEIEDFLYITKPKDIKLNVIPKDPLLRKSMESILNKILKSINGQEIEETNNSFNFKEIQNRSNKSLSTNRKSDFCRLPPKRIKFS